MTPSSSTRALNLAADSAQPAPEDTAKTTKMRNTSSHKEQENHTNPATGACRAES